MLVKLFSFPWVPSTLVSRNSYNSSFQSYLEMSVVIWRSCVRFFVVLVSVLQVWSYPFHTTTINVPTKPTDPFLLEYHATRYYGGCFDVMKQNYHYNTIIPWIQNFDVVVTGCGVNWGNPGVSQTQTSCAFTFGGNRNTTEHKIERVHVHADYRHHRYFFEAVFPYYEQRFKDTGAGFILHSGGGDSGPNPDHFKRILQSPSILRWVLEQNRLEELANQPKMMYLPVGICVRENAGERGKDLRLAIHMDTDGEDRRKRRTRRSRSRRQLTARNNSISSDSHLAVRHEHLHLQQGAVHSTVVADTTQQSSMQQQDQHQQLQVHETHVLLKERMLTASKHWSQRKDRIYLCFNEGPYDGRQKFMAYARSGNCTVCDVCPALMPAGELWKQYGEYKYVLSPWGNGVDCGRSWEIMLMGAIPVIEYFPGAVGYMNAGLSAVTVKEPEELNDTTIAKWSGEFKKGTDHSRLTLDYWRNYVFNENF